MIALYDKDHVFLGCLSKYKDLKIESTLSTGEKTLTFDYEADECEAEPEYYLRTEDDEYVVKEKEYTPTGISYAASLNLEGLESVVWKSFEVTDITIEEAAEKALTDTGWTVGECTVTKVRNAGIQMATSKDVIDKLCTAFMCERVYDTINKTVSFYDEAGEDKGVYFLRGLNLKELKVTSDSYDYYTRIIPIGADELTIEDVNDGKNYLENYQYSSKIRPYIWEDYSYTDAETLMEDAELKLADMSKPTKAYEVDIIDLASQSQLYEVLSYGLGDTVTIIDAVANVREKQRIVKMTEYPQSPLKNSCELSNTVLTFEELYSKLQSAADIINNVTSSDGTVSGYYVHGVKAGDVVGIETVVNDSIDGSETIQNIIERLETLENN
ncbi:MAG: phage tail protein [Lachnospiraceae bacterium]|nr:phage tail protein [Lachnospiraceae bacterium]